MTEAEIQAQMEAATLALEVRDLAFAIADTCCTFDIEAYHYTVVSDGVEWRDLHMLRRESERPNVERALRYLTLRGVLVTHPAYPNLVRIQSPDTEGPEAPTC